MKLTGDHSSASAHRESLANAQVHVPAVKGDILEQQGAFILCLWVEVPLKSSEDVLLNPSQHRQLAHLFISPVKYLAVGLREDHESSFHWEIPTDLVESQISKTGC